LALATNHAGVKTTVFHNIDAPTPSSYSAAVVYLYYIVFTLAVTVCNAGLELHKLASMAKCTEMAVDHIEI